MLFEGLALPMRWQLRDRSASRTFARLPWPQPFFRAAGGETSRRPTPPELIRFATRPLPGLRPAPRALAGRLIEAARLAMATRLRELFAFSHANPADVMIADPGRGLRIALIGIRPELRLPLEGYYAYLALRNGVPIGYGAGWQFLGTLELAVNVFDPYRGGESALVLGEVLRAYHQAFGMRAVRVDPYQIGHGNPEALAAGAFYFYYHLGFRPEDPQTRRRAQREQRIVARRPAYRSPRAVLRELARSPMRLALARGKPAAADVTASGVAALVTGHIALRHDGDRRAAAGAAVARVARALGAGQRAGWPRAERQAFERLCLVVNLIPDLERWPVRDRHRLVDVLRARGGRTEARYVRLLAGHARLARSLAALVARGDLHPPERSGSG